MKPESGLCSMTQRQKSIVGYGVTSLGILGVVLLVSLVVAASWFVVGRLHSVFEPLALGLLLSCVLKEPFLKARIWFSFGKCKSLEEINKEGANDWWGLLVAILFVTVVIFFIGFGIYRFGAFIVGQFSSLGSNLPHLVDKCMSNTPWLRGVLEGAGVDVTALLKKVPSYFLAHFDSLVSVKEMVSTWVFAAIFCYCFLENPVHGSMIGNELKGLSLILGNSAGSGQTVEFLERQFDRFCDTMTKYFPKQLIINFVIEGLIGGVALMAIRLPFGFVLGFLMGGLNIIPFYGTIAVLPIILLVARFGEGGSLSLTLTSFAIWLLVQIADFLLPMTMHKKDMKLSPGVIIFSFLFWGAVISPIWGMILAIPLSAFTIGLWRSIKELLARPDRSMK